MPPQKEKPRPQEGAPHVGFVHTPGEEVEEEEEMEEATAAAVRFKRGFTLEWRGVWGIAGLRAFLGGDFLAAEVYLGVEWSSAGLKAAVCPGRTF